MKPVPNMENISAVDVNAIKITMEIDVNTGMNVHLIRIVVFKANVLILTEPRYQRNNVTAI